MRPRIRTIKPETALDEELWDLGTRTGLPVFQAFTILWCYVDREGRFEWRPRALGALVLPYWAGDFADVLNALEGSGFLVCYEVDGRRYGYVRNFLKHQAPNSREPASNFPNPQGPDVTHVRAHADTSPTRARPAVPDPVPDPVPDGGDGGSGSPSVAKSDAGRRKRRERFAPADFEPSDKHRSLASEHGINIDEQLVAFKDYEFDKPKSDWSRAFSNWLRRSKEFTRNGSRASPGQRPPQPNSNYNFDRYRQ